MHNDLLIIVHCDGELTIKSSLLTGTVTVHRYDANATYKWDSSGDDGVMGEEQVIEITPR